MVFNPHTMSAPLEFSRTDKVEVDQSSFSKLWRPFEFAVGRSETR